MKWTQEDGYITTRGPLRASIKYRKYGSDYEIRIGGLSAHGTADTEDEAKQFAEEQLQIAKRAFILSLITKFSDDLYILGIGVMQIVGGYDGIDLWRVYQNSEHELFEGTLEECKNYIVSCF